jgi:hypothetical protein
VSNQALRRTVNNLIRQSAGEIAARVIPGHGTQEMTEHYSDVTVDEKQLAQQRALGELVGVRGWGSPKTDETPARRSPETRKKMWRAMQDSNLRPSASEADTLSS